ncbi:VOC family protein [Streptomyces sp. INA 01156]
MSKDMGESLASTAGSGSTSRPTPTPPRTSRRCCPAASNSPGTASRPSAATTRLERPTGGHRSAVAFEYPDPQAVDTAYAELVDAGYVGHIKPWDAVWGQRYAIVLDPDGIAVDLYAALPA